ncbi:hypothetical protein IW252_001195 [Zhihengliuella flava]|uniref:Uncharacterized protein n=1 Tax=Zhihengliuella flava TaxID=1285193 RepID=A0A931DCN9_9MICC|nr:hypothetical protein [Zhihengliuella flava]
MDSVKSGVPASQWCAGHPTAQKKGFLARLLGR